MSANARISDVDLEKAMLDLAARCAPGKTFDPTDVARAIAGASPDSWGRIMQPVRRMAVRLAEEGRLVIYRKGKPADPADFKGVYRLGPPRLD
ncbi:conserved hypothetical protein [Hyphomicrobiales bacterium]|nr:conserved hypothetical protein [Hyphomicrobiales bacterium]CAH1666075.1 conserved hypothetical protein [Hyphomicrobiales bacterium]